jgi:hypothetical protein
LRAASLKFRIYITAGIYSIVFRYIYFSDVTWLELLTISTNSIWKLLWIGTKEYFKSQSEKTMQNGINPKYSN